MREPTPTAADREKARLILAMGLQPVDPGAMLAAMARDPRYHGHAVEEVAKALANERAATAEACAVAYRVCQYGESADEAAGVIEIVRDGSVPGGATAAILRAGGAL